VTTDGGGGGGQYQSATDRNTSTDWLDDMKPVDVKLDGMSDYAGNMMTIMNNLKDHNTYLVQQMNDLVEVAFAGGFPEISEAATLHKQNVQEFASYNSFLMTSLVNIGSAAQTIADSYASTDGWSAASLSSVEFAFGDKSAGRPPGLPAALGKTYYDKYFEDMAKEDPGASGGSDSNWRVQSTTTDPKTGAEKSTYVDQHGNLRTITVTTANGVKTTVIESGGKKTTTVERTVYHPNGSITTKTITTPDGKSTTTESETSSTADGHETTDFNSKGQATNSTTVKHNSDGTETDTTTSYDKKGHGTTTSQVSVAQEGPDVDVTADSPTDDVVKKLQKQIKAP
jgi:hypothetical protein